MRDVSKQKFTAKSVLFKHQKRNFSQDEYEKLALAMQASHRSSKSKGNLGSEKGGSELDASDASLKTSALQVQRKIVTPRFT